MSRWTVRVSCTTGSAALPGAFDKISRGIGLINAAKSQRKQNKPLINIQCTINRHNYQRLDEFIEAVRQFKANAVTFHNLIFLNQEAIAKQKRIDGLLNCSSQDWEGFIFEPGIDSKKLYQKLKAILSREYPLAWIISRICLKRPCCLITAMITSSRLRRPLS